MLKLELIRYNLGRFATLGWLLDNDGDRRSMLCFTCEDIYRPEKVAASTRIPAGTYQLDLRTTGGMHARYLAKNPNTHKGMIWLRDVPNFSWVYIHIGNDEDDTAGCILVGENRTERDQSIMQSRAAYDRIYPSIAAAILDKGAQITVVDWDRPILPSL